MTVNRELIEQHHWCEYCKFVIGNDSVCKKCGQNRCKTNTLWRIAEDIETRMQILNEHGYAELSKYLKNRKKEIGADV